MKIRSLNEFYDAVDGETAWRRQELTTIKLEVKKAQTTKPAGKVALRSALALLYAHWEGWVKEVSKLYIEFLNSRRVMLRELSPPFMGTALRQRLIELEETTKAERHTSFSAFILSDLNQRAVFKDTDLPINSNLNFARFKEILSRFGLDVADYDTLENKIDADLLAQRNLIAHGEKVRVEKDAYLELHDLILNQLSSFTTDVLNSAAMESYMSGFSVS